MGLNCQGEAHGWVTLELHHMLVDPQISDDEHQLDIRLLGFVQGELKPEAEVTFAPLCMCSLDQEIYTKTLTHDSVLVPNQKLSFVVCLFVFAFLLL